MSLRTVKKSHCNDMISAGLDHQSPRHLFTGAEDIEAFGETSINLRKEHITHHGKEGGG